MSVKPILKAKNLVKRIQGRTILSDVSFELRPGEVVGLLGPNGAGKTTAFYVTIGLVRPDEGSLHLEDEDVTHLPIHKRATKGMGYLAQEPSIFRNLTVRENLLAYLETLPITKEEQLKRLEASLEDLHLKPNENKKAYLLSGGEKRRVEIARALLTNPSILLLDEPFANIDPITISDVKKMVTMLKTRGISVFITDHNARELFSLVDFCYLLNDGVILSHGPVKEFMECDIVKNHYLGQDFHS